MIHLSIMATEDALRTPYEQRVDQVVQQFGAVNANKLTLFSGDGGASGHYWELTPRIQGGAKVHIYAVSKSAINMTVADYFWVKIPVIDDRWGEALTTLGAYLQAVIDGRITGWFVNEYGPPKYVLEFDFGNDEPVQFSSNVHFPESFKEHDDVYRIQYQKY